MKLNIDCCRDILLYLEENLKVNYNQIPKHELIDNLKSDKYTDEEIHYCIIMLYENRLIKADIVELPTQIGGYIKFDINNISLNGHEFINTFRSDEVWNQAKSKAEEIDIISFQSLSMIANKILKEKIDNL